MQLIIGSVNIKPMGQYPVVAIGNFDGLHLGHRAILANAVCRARAHDGRAIVLTFEPHPAQLLSPDRKLRLLYPFQSKIRLLESTGVDVTDVADFTHAFAQLPPREFAQIFLHDKMGAREVLIGGDFKFGKDRAGTVADLMQLGKEYGFNVHVQAPVVVEQMIVSSSKIRELIGEGNVGLAAKMLGRDYAVEGRVVHGDNMGKALGYPTANLRLPNELIPKEGIYAVRVSILRVEGVIACDGIVYIGTKPTFTPRREAQIEVHLFDHTEDLYGRRLIVTFIAWVRGDEKFSDAAALARQIREDIKQAKSILKAAKPISL